MKLKDKFNYDIEPYRVLRDSARAVSKAYLDGNRFLDTTKEYVYIEQSLKYCSEIIHRQAHKFLKLLDDFGDMLHERHLMQEYPETPELNWREELKDMDGVFEFIVRVLENVHEALEEFHKATDNAQFRPMALYTEELMLTNSQDHTKFLEMWAIYDQLNEKGSMGSPTSFDSYCKKLLDEEGDKE